MGRRAVGSFVILRIISPSIVSPAWMQLDLDGLNHSGRRALVDVSKLVTNLANDVVLGQKESHMGEFQGFRSPANIQAMERFLDGLQVRTTSRSFAIASTDTSLSLMDRSPTPPLLLPLRRSHQRQMRMTQTSFSSASCSRNTLRPSTITLEAILVGKKFENSLLLRRHLDRKPLSTS